ncbi:matrixin family metalloprotease [Pannonibacter sp. SL95]|uniref:matrixin family metalloprotease n=1 Tax=Pannonibacter sp. SL95 TaxID=2995153 RepID=UPI00227267C4|nr:matrixin family metalloprotease [Pannonibacter sp. SL95]MCY1708347.1 matrixin family metalloprotease [Pannonibacter sp. SL95]
MTHLIGYSFAPGGLATNGLLQSAGPTVSWSSAFGSFDYKAAVRAACRKWADVCDVEFCEVTDPGVSINAGTVGMQRMFLGPIDGASGLNVVANATPPGGLPFSGNILYDSDATDINFLATGYMLSVTVHEMGHAVFGMLHNTTDSVMNGIGNDTPTAYDRQLATATHGAAKSLSAKVGSGSLIGQIYSAYKGAYDITVSNDDLFYWYRQIATNTNTFATLCTAMAGSYAPSRVWLQSLYTRVLGRSGSSAEIDAWIATGKNCGQILKDFAESVEAANRRASLFASGLWFS